MKHILMALTGVLVAGALPTHAAVVSNFNLNDEGWRSVTLGFPDPGTPPAILQTFVPNWLPAGGNPGGYITNNDPNGNVQYWLAPASFLGNQSAAYSNSLLFSLMDSPVGAGFDQADIILTGGGLTLTRQLPSVPNATWTSYTIPLIAGSWHLNSPSGAVASSANLQTALGSLTGLYIRGEFYLTNDQQSIDSVQLQTDAAAVPEPATLTALLFGLGAMIAAKRKTSR
jgi:Laminin B (Domain IV)